MKIQKIPINRYDVVLTMSDVEHQSITRDLDYILNNCGTGLCVGTVNLIEKLRGIL